MKKGLLRMQLPRHRPLTVGRYQKKRCCTERATPLFQSAPKGIFSSSFFSWISFHKSAATGAQALA